MTRKIITHVVLDSKTVENIKGLSEERKETFSHTTRFLLEQGFKFKDFELDEELMKVIEHKAKISDLPREFGINYFLLRGILGPENFEKIRVAYIERLHKIGILPSRRHE